jgi:magnesium-transporting ATPase (P-type)
MVKYLLRGGILFKEERNFISRLSRRTKICMLGVIISFFSIFIVNFSVIAFCVFYILGVFLILISAFNGIEKFNKNVLGEIISRIALALIMLGIFSPMGIIENSFFSNIQFVGFVLMIVGISLKSPSEGKEEKDY